MKLLLIEDAATDIDAFRTALDLYNQEKEDTGAIITADDIPSIKEFMGRKLLGYDAVIVDIKLQDTKGIENADIEAGNKIIEIIETSLQNIPIYIYTGTPENINNDHSKFVIKTYIKGEDTTYKQVIDHAYKLYNTGLMQIIGGGGKIQELVQRIYKENIIQDIDKWIEHKNDGKQTEDILSRYIAACITAHLENSCDAVKEEMIMIPPVGSNLKTGSILKKKDTEEYFVVLTPECDLIVRRNRNPNTDFVLLCKLQSKTNSINASTLKDMLKYKIPYAYCLPKNAILGYATFLNFRIITSSPYSTVVDCYEKIAQILPEFTKEITQKFSTYYSRQGQPEFADGELCNGHFYKEE